MAARVIFCTRLVEGASGEDYERWVVDTDYPLARSLDTIESYEVMRVQGPFADAGLDYDYIEVVDVTDIDGYRSELATFPGRERFVSEIRSFLGPPDAVWGTVIR